MASCDKDNNMEQMTEQQKTEIRLNALIGNLISQRDAANTALARAQADKSVLEAELAASKELVRLLKIDIEHLQKVSAEVSEQPSSKRGNNTDKSSASKN